MYIYFFYGRKIIYKIILLLLLSLTVTNCGSGGSDSQIDILPVCGPFSEPQSSTFKLPYVVGTSYFLNQSNCSGFGHSGFWEYGYDFTMDIGSEVNAMRSGVVVHTQDGAIDGDTNATNLILIQHDDGSIALYSHLTTGGVIISIADIIVQGESIGLSGNTGNTGGLPHLHVSLHPCIGLPGLSGIAQANCPSQPFSFNNSEPQMDNLIAKRNYLALP